MRRTLVVLALVLPWVGCDTRPNEPSAQRVMEHQTYLPPSESMRASEGRTLLVQSTDAKPQDKQPHVSEDQQVKQAIAVMLPVGNSRVVGSIVFKQVDAGVEVTGELRNLTPGKHGFHVHEFGDVSDLEKGESAGGHFNPDGHEHGDRDSEVRHAGDFGNIEADSNGKATIQFVDSKIQLAGAASIIGRGLVVHADEDKFTQPTGDAGARVALGVIGVAKSQ